MASRPPRPPPPVPEDEDLIDEDEEEMLEDEDLEDEGMDMLDALGSLLATEDGETIAQSLSGLRDAADKIALNMEMQNKILVKILSAITKLAAPAPAPVPEVAAPADSA